MVNSDEECEVGKQEGGGGGGRKKESIFKILFFFPLSHYSDFTDPKFGENNDLKAPEYWGGG